MNKIKRNSDNKKGNKEVCGNFYITKSIIITKKYLKKKRDK